MFIVFPETTLYKKRSFWIDHNYDITLYNDLLIIENACTSLGLCNEIILKLCVCVYVSHDAKHVNSAYTYTLNL